MKKKEEYLVDPNFFGTLREGLLDGEPITVAIEEIGPAMLAQLARDGPVQLEFKEPGSFARVAPPPPPSTGTQKEVCVGRRPNFDQIFTCAERRKKN